MNDKEFLTWVRARLEHVYGENPNIDYMIRLSEVIKSMPDTNFIGFKDFGEKIMNDTDRLINGIKSLTEILFNTDIPYCDKEERDLIIKINNAIAELQIIRAEKNAVEDYKRWGILWLT